MKRIGVFFLIIILAGCMTSDKNRESGTVEAAEKKETAGGTVETTKKNNILIPGKGYNILILNKTDITYFKNHKKDIITYNEMGFWFEFNRNNILVLIGTMGPGIRTLEGIKIGNSEEEVIRLYGKPDKKDYEKRIYPKEFHGFDSMFDYTLIYKGVLFYINEGTVMTIAIYSEDALK